MRFLVGMGFPREDAEDAAAETLVQVCRTIHQVRSDDAVTNWAMTIRLSVGPQKAGRCRFC
jgi:DNA-directed RNA polymerase specialized sigma24 family protein